MLLATNTDLAAEVAAGRFRRDLFYRINVVNIELPPLRERPGDIALLARHFLSTCADEASKAAPALTGEALRRLEQYSWPGNVRELENCMERAVLLCRNGEVRPEDLPPALRADSGEGVSVALAAPERPMSLSEALTGPERQILRMALARNGGNRQRTAAELQINRTTLYKKRKKYGLLD